MKKDFFETNMGSEKEQLSENDNVLIEKFAILRTGVVQHMKISDNPVVISEFMYDVMYHPEEAERIIEQLDIKDSEKFPDRVSLLRKSVAINSGNMPSKDVFVHEITRALTVDPDFENCVNPEVSKQIEAMLEKGVVRIWTAGDNNGAMDESGEFHSGVHGQLKKIAKAKIFNAIRNSYAKNNFSAEEYLEKRADALSVRSSENKFELLPEIIEEFRKKGVSTVFVVEDNLAYLLRAEEIFSGAGFSVKSVWVRQGANRNKIPKESGQNLEYYLEKCNAVDSVGGITEILEKSGDDSEESKCGFVVDFDDVIMDSGLKLKAQGMAMVKKMKEKKWI